MIFETLYQSAKRGELLLIDGGICHWHLRRDKQITIREIISTKKGAGSKMLKILVAIGYENRATSIFAKCPIDLEANGWYQKRGFILEDIETTKSGKKLNHWRLKI